MRLSENFWLKEFLASQTAERSGGAMLEAQMNPDEGIVDALTYLASETLQPLRYLLNTSIKVSSGYRCPELNERIRGSARSQHMVGQAADIMLSSEFLTVKRCARPRGVLRRKIEAVTKSPVSDSSNSNYFLFATACLYLHELDVDQVIHEYGVDGSPAWVHVSSSTEKNRRQILIKRRGESYLDLTLEEALLLGCQ